MPAVALPTQSNPQEYREQGNDRLVNCFAEKIDAKRYRIRAWYGLTPVNNDVDDVNIRGSIEVDDALYAIFEGGGIRKFTRSGDVITRTDLAYISGSGPVFMARNQRDPVQIGILTSSGRYYVIENDVVRNISVDDLPPFNSLCEVGGYFVFGSPSGEVFSGGFNDAVTIGGLDSFVAEGHPDGLVVVFKNRLELVVFGNKTMEVWGQDSNPPATGSPFVRLGGAVFPKGALNSICVAELDNTFFWIGEDGIVYRNIAYTPKRVSHYGVERSIAQETAKSEIRVSAFVKEGNSFLVINGSRFTWVYNAATSGWHELSEQNSSRGIAETYITIWNEVYAFSKIDGNLYLVDSSSRTENNFLVPVIIEGMDTGRDAPLICHSVEVDFVTGRAPISGASNIIAPTVELRWSDDGGATWPGNRPLSLGIHGDYRKRIRTTRLGRTGPKWGRRWMLYITDPHVVALTQFKINEGVV